MKINVRIDYTGKHISCSTYLDVDHIEQEDDGSFTASILDPSGTPSSTWKEIKDES